MRIVKFYFTGTDTTKKTVDLFADVLAQDLGVRELVDYNYSRPAVRQARPCFKSTDIVVSGLSTIAGRVPNLLLPYLNRIEGKGARSICISMYGNRNVDDCLLEHRDLLKKGNPTAVALLAAYIKYHAHEKLSTALQSIYQLLRTGPVRDNKPVHSGGRHINILTLICDRGSRGHQNIWPLLDTF